jgi:hypothetical protein
VYYAAELRYAEMQILAQQLILPYLLYMPARRRVVLDLEPVRTQI